MDNETEFRAWAAWFADWEKHQEKIPWDSRVRATMAERNAIAKSVAEFQLGESSDGRNLYAKALAHAGVIGDPDYAASVMGLIVEENRHAAYLGRFMDLEGLPRKKRTGVDSMFRALRHLVSLRLSHRTLLTAEFIAVPYYTALGQACSSPILKAICKQILDDEARHIAFQSACIRSQAPRGGFLQWCHRTFGRVALEIALDLVWWNHSDVLQRGGYGFGRLREEALEQFSWSLAMVSGEIPIPEPGKHRYPSNGNEDHGNAA